MVETDEERAESELLGKTGDTVGVAVRRTREEGAAAIATAKLKVRSSIGMKNMFYA